jgi:hypothetical protein
MSQPSRILAFQRIGKLPEFPETYDYFESDNAIFRRAKSARTDMIDDVYRPDTATWSPYDGDRLWPAKFGDKTTDPETR